MSHWFVSFFILSQISVAAANPAALPEQEVLNELLIVSTEKKAMDQIDKLIRKHRGSSLEPELLLRKGTLFQRRGQSARYFDFQREESGVLSLLPPVVKTLNSKNMLKQAISVFEEVRRRYPRFVRSDEVIFNIAFSLQQLGRFQEAKTKFLDLCRLFPDSTMIADAYLAAAEIDFDSKDFKSALTNYSLVPETENRFAFVYARYKTAWSHYNLQMVGEGLSDLEKVAAWHDVEDPDSLGFNLRPDALKDMVFFFADVKKWKEAIGYFVEHAKEEAPKYIFMLGKTYQYRDQWQDVEMLFLAFLDRFSKHEKVPEVYVELMATYQRKNDFGKVIGVLKDFQQFCPPTQETCLKLFFKTAQEYAVKWHKSWRTTSNRAYAEHATKSYRLYLEVKKGGLAKDKTQFQLAELLFEMGQFDQASIEYEQVAKIIADPLLAHDAPYGAIVSLEKSVGENKWNEEQTARFHRLIDLYVERNPKGKYRLDLTFKKALIAFENKDFKMAGPLFLEIGQSRQVTEKVIKSQDLYLDILNQLKDYSALAKLAGHWSQVADKERREKLHVIAVEAEFASIQVLRDSGKLKEAAQLFAEFAEKHSSSPLAEKAGWNRIHILLELERSAEAANASLQFSKKYPKSEYALEALSLAAAHFEKAGELLQAAQALQQLAAVEKVLKTQLERLFAAGQFYQLMQKPQQAEKVYRQMIDLGSMQNDEMRSKAMFQLWEVADDKASVLKMMANSSDEELLGFYHLEMAKRYFLEKNMTEAFRYSSKVLALKKVDSAWKAQARWFQANILKSEFMSQSVAVSQASRLAMVLSIKTEKLQKAQNAMQSVIRYGQADLAAKSYLELGLIYKEYVHALSEMKMPDGLSMADQQALRQELDRLAAPMEDQAAQSFAEGLKFARKNGVFNSVVAELQKELNKINMQTEVVALTQPQLELQLMVPEWRAPL